MAKRTSSAPARADVLLHPVRLRIVLALAGRTMTVSALGEHLGDVPQASLYRHVGKLADAGMIRVVDERKARGGVERTYGLVDAAVALGDEDVTDTDAGDHLRYFVTFLGTLIADFAAYLDSSHADFEADGVGYRQAALWLDDDEFTQLVSEMRAPLVARIDNQPAPSRRRRLLTTIVMPDTRADTD